VWQTGSAVSPGFKAFAQEPYPLGPPHPAPGNMFAKKFEEFAMQDKMKIGMTTIDKIPDEASRDTTEMQSARSPLSSEVSVDSGFFPYSFTGGVSPKTAKMFAFAKTLEFARSAHVLSIIKAARAETELTDKEPERKSVPQNEYNNESGIGSEMKSDESSDSDEDVIIGETDEEELAKTGKKLPHFLLDILGSRRHQDVISWTFTDGFSFQIEKIKEIAELWSDQRSRSPKKKTKTTLSMQFARSVKHYTDKGVLRRNSEDGLCYAFTGHPGKFSVASQKWKDMYEASRAAGLVADQE